MNENPVDRRMVIVAGLSLSPTARAVAGEAAFFGRTLGARVVFVHGGEDTPAVRSALSGTLHPFETGGASPDLVIVPGPADLAVGAVARRVKAGLILIGGGGIEDQRKGVVGATARRIARNAPCSVLLLPSPRAEGARFRCIALAAFQEAGEIDSSLVRFLIELGGAHRSATVLVIEEVDPREIGGNAGLDRADPVYHPEDPEVREKRCGSLGLNELGLRFPNLEYVPVPGCDGEGIARGARSRGVDLLAMPVPAEGLSLWDRVFKHPLETILKKPPCALLFHRPPAIEAPVSGNDAATGTTAESTFPALL